MRQARLRVQQRCGRLRLRADLAGGRPQGVGGLQVVSALHASAALGTVTDVDAELPHDRPARDLGLELLGHGALDEAALTVGAGVGERGLVAFADLFRRWRGAMAVRAVRLAGLAARRLGIGLGRTLAERGGLPFAGAQGALEAPGQFRDLGFEFGDALEQRPTTGTGRLFHTAMVATRRPVSCASCPPGTTALPTGALYKYLEWLRADLTLRKKQLDGDQPKDQTEAQAKLRFWRSDPDLAGVRDPDALGTLPEAEQAEWKKLWADAADALQPASPRK
jgi:hypothetical protein